MDSVKRLSARGSLLCLLLIALLAGCGGGGSSASSASVASSTYLVEYIPGTGADAPVQGKSAIQLRITKRSNGSAATGLNPSLSMIMHMMNGVNHATPLDLVSESTTTPGTYDCTAYFLMASKDGMGNTMGTWDLNVTVAGETTMFNPDVVMPMGSDTVRTTLYGADDIISGPSSTSYNKYYIFRDGPISASTPTFSIYISHSENMIMNFKAVSAGSILSEPTGTVTSMVVSAATDTSFASPGTSFDNGNGHWVVSGLSGLSSGVTSTIYVKLQVNGQDKTTNGSAASGSNAYAAFAVTPGM